MYKQKRYRYIYNLEDMQRVFDIAASKTEIFLENDEYKYEYGKTNLTAESRVICTDRYYKLTTKYVNEDLTVAKEEYPCTWIFDLTGDETHHIHPSVVAKKYLKHYKPYEVIKERPELFRKLCDGKLVESAKAVVGYNKAFDNTEHNVVAYDLNSAYAAVLTDKIIDTYNMDVAREVKENEIGFLLNSELTMMHPGEEADVIFPLIDSPFKDYVTEWYNKKKDAPKGSADRDIAKEVLVITVGLWQNRNPFLRAYVVNSCNEFIERLILRNEDKVCMWNTDAIYCTERIPEIDALCGTDIGQFKVEYEGLFRQKGTAYQKVDIDETSYRGVIKQLFKKGFNLLTDELPKHILPYKMNEQTLRVEKNKEFPDA